MTVSRRQFASASSLSVAALGLARLPGVAHTSATSLKGFEDVAQVNARSGLAGVLESAYDELAKK